MQIRQRQLGNESGTIMRRLNEGTSSMVTSNGVPVGELTPLRADRYVRAEAMLANFAPAPPVDLERLRADLDATASQDLEPRA
jgi:antitoxin (DNA-binding transcriptional repressor) of toxin-antitoxin stability system